MAREASSGTGPSWARWASHDLSVMRPSIDPYRPSMSHLPPTAGSCPTPLPPDHSANAFTALDKAKLSLDPLTLAAITISTAGRKAVGELDVPAALKALRAITEPLHDGDTRCVEAMLAAQALTLNVAFHDLFRRADAHLGSSLSAAETLMRLALKAQAQSRSTLETLANLKHPRFVVAGQANISHGGHMQVNNISRDARISEKSAAIPQNELSARTDVLPTNTRAPRRGRRKDQADAALVEVDRAADG